jgi:uncharacterized protein YbaA (DUF1428 family)
VSRIDGFVVQVHVKNLQVSRRMVRLCGKVWREHGGLE